METLKKRRDFSFVYRRGKPFYSANMVLVSLHRKGGPVKTGFSVSKKIGCAVKRNQVRRRMKEAMRQLERENRAATLPCYMIFIAKPPIADAPYAAIVRDMERLMKKMSDSKTSSAGDRQ